MSVEREEGSEPQPAEPPAVSDGSLVDPPVNLLFDVNDLTSLLEQATLREDWLDATLAVSGIQQAIDDYLAHTSSLVGRVFATGSRAGSTAGRIVAKQIGLANKAVVRAERVAGDRRQVEDARAHLLELSVDLALGAISGKLAPGASERVTSVVAALRSLPENARQSLVRLPSCFRAFDQHPADIAWLASEYARRFPDRARPVIVAGVRTSGSYLAPFCAAFLRRQGFSDVAVIGTRASQPLLDEDARTIDRLRSNKPQVVIVDDPPASGRAIADVCDVLEAAGIERQALVLLLASFDDQPELPQRISNYGSIVLPWSDWSIHDRLGERVVRGVIEDSLGDGSVLSLKPVEIASRARRGHIWARYEVEVATGKKSRKTLQVVAQGAGIGYFGAHELAVANALGSSGPRIYGLSDGVLVREWIDDSRRVIPAPAQVVDHIVARSEALSVKADRSVGLAGCQPLWEVASEQLARVYGRFWTIARVLFVDRLVRALLVPGKTSVVAGDFGEQKWFTAADDADGTSGAGSVEGATRYAGDATGERIVKVGGSERAFSNLDLISFDPAYDLVSYAMSLDDQEAGKARRLFESRVAPVSDERWLLYELVRIWDERRNGVVDRYQAARKRSSAFRRYLSHTYMPVMKANKTGALVALDVDGVVESEVFGGKAPSPSSAMAIRSLVTHGYMPVVVTGRCLDDVREMCAQLKLSGGACEYGSVIYNATQDEVVSSLTLEQQELVRKVRQQLAAEADVYVDPQYEYCVRASSVSPSGKLRSLPAKLIKKVEAEGLVAVHGNLQTDFVVPGINKGTALKALVKNLNAPRVAFVVGDTDNDVPMMVGSALSATPAHASDRAKSVAQVVARRPYQAGLKEIVDGFIGGNHRRCKQCRLPMSAETAAMVAVLSATESSRVAVIPRTLFAMWKTMKLERSTRALRATRSKQEQKAGFGS